MKILIFIFLAVSAFWGGFSLGTLHQGKGGKKGVVSSEITQEYRNFLEYDGSEQN